MREADQKIQPRCTPTTFIFNAAFPFAQSTEGKLIAPRSATGAEKLGDSGGSP